MLSVDTAGLMTVPPAPAVAPVPGVNPDRPYSTMNASPPVQLPHVHETSKPSVVTLLAVGASGVFNGKLTPLITVEEMDEITSVELGNFTLPGQ